MDSGQYVIRATLAVPLSIPPRCHPSRQILDRASEHFFYFFDGLHRPAGANIESLAVGLNIDKALFTIATTGNKPAIANLVKQLSKLVKVRALRRALP